MPLSRIECNKAFAITEIDQQIERYGALYLASRRQQHHRGQQPLLIVIEDMGYLLDSDWNTVTDQGKSDDEKQCSCLPNNELNRLIFYFYFYFYNSSQTSSNHPAPEITRYMHHGKKKTQNNDLYAI